MFRPIALAGLLLASAISYTDAAAVAGLKKQLEEIKQSTDMEFKRGKIFQQWTILLLVLDLGAFGYLFKQLF